ncbi:hepatocyte growth factor receptor [Plakobranchus ocellatus]|uniref:Hepatocyte growth factor receptor n=1 Tax=Plakobranchus ocellatus TaxID=259542 RepID=A0AAV3Z5F8_9GAST|nr:hepatocyte growth factor receptor [Plakobranchus ocellatus]
MEAPVLSFHKKFKVQQSVTKVMATVFWDSRGMILLDILPKGESLNANRCCETLDWLRHAVQRKRPRVLHSGVVLQHNSATPQTAKRTKEWLERYRWDIIPHPAHSPDLAFSDFPLLGHLKRHLGGKKFEDEDELIGEVRDWFSKLDAKFFTQGNARSCTYDDNDGNYKCICDFETNTRGINCGTCELNFARSLSQFGCPNTCSCNMDGVANENDMCDQVNGLCKCKKNVEGPFCDICKPFTYKLEESNPDGCSVCSCNQRGSLLCSNTTGQCQCQDNTVSDKCDRCADDSFGFADGCQLCDCSSAGTLEQRTNCTESGQCACKENVMGLKCNSCKPGFYGLNSNNVMGCVACSCHSIGAENTTCDSLTGQCQCKGGDVTDLACTPVILSIDPTFGPEVGGTLVTIKGRLFGKDTSNVKIFLGDKLQQIISIDESTIVFSTLQYNKTDGSDNKSPSLHLQWKGVNDITNTPLKFEYVSDPMYDFTRNTEVITYQRGGCHVEVYGSNLNNVKKPRLEFTNTARPGVNVYGTCFHKMNHIRCITPNLKSILATSGNNFIMKVLLDGFEAVRDVNVLPDPVLDDAGSIKFQYPFEDSVDLSGKNLKSSCSVSVFLGVINCEIKHLSDTSIQFAPPVSPPGGRKKHIIEVHIGESKMTAGTLEYLELYETTGFIIIVSCIAAAIIIAVVGVIICCCCRIRRNQAPPSSRSTSAKTTTASSNKQSVEVDTRPMNNYSELVTLVDASVAPATSNGHNSLVQMETVVKEHKKGIVNSEAEDNILAEEFLPRVEPGIRDGVKKCYIGAGHFVPGRACIIRGRHIQLVNGTLQRNGAAVQKLTIKSVIHHLTEQNLPTWANLALSECLRLKHFKHNHILSIIGIGANQHTFHIVYPSMTQGTLKAVISDTSKDFSVRQLLGFGQQVAEGIDFLASKDVTHKDVAARNCMMDEYSVVKLSDASFSWDLYPNEYMYDESRERHLPIRWMAPESLQDGYYDMRTDVWSFAVLVWELLTRGCLPFHEVTDSAGVSEYILQGYILGRPDTLSIDVYELLRICWSPENESRPSIATVSRTLSEILEADDDETYANAGELASYQQQHSSGLAASPRHHAGKTSTQP